MIVHQKPKSGEQEDQESKVMMNSRSSSNKQSHVEGNVNNFIIAIFFIQVRDSRGISF